MASKGHRVIGCAQLKLSGEKYPDNFIFQKDDEDKKPEIAASPSAPHGVFPKTGYTFTGLVSLEDPPKHGVREAIGKCRQAGIKVMMVTGDHPLTAEVCVEIRIVWSPNLNPPSFSSIGHRSQDQLDGPGDS